ncbi:MAG: NAD(P)-dependent oxidoreductase [Burkholderiaceae bacterium]|nr:NAD(P)-dependent oxidoreductase [Burkholderiaceae bacterium]
MAFSVGIVGVGNMGGAMAQRLCGLGWAPWVHDVDAAKVQDSMLFGALAPVNIAQAASKSIATIVCVVDAAQTRDVLFGPLGLVPHLPVDHVVVLCPTMAPQEVEAIAAQLAERGIHTIDAPMSGGPARARDGSMSLMVAGEDAVVARMQPLLDALSSKVFRISHRVGDGARTKLVNNLLAGINLVGAAEVMALAGRMGLDLNRTLDVVEQSSGQSWIGSDRMRRAIAGDLAPRAHMTLLAKDTRLAQEAAAHAGFSGPLGAHTSAVFAAAVAAGLEGLDDGALLEFLQRPKMAE